MAAATGVAADGIMPGRMLVRVDRRYFRPTELFSLLTDASKARRAPGWQPTATFGELSAGMVRADVAGAGSWRVASPPTWSPYAGALPGGSFSSLKVSNGSATRRLASVFQATSPGVSRRR